MPWRLTSSFLPGGVDGLLARLGYRVDTGWVPAEAFDDLATHRFAMQEARREMSVIGAFCLKRECNDSDVVATPLVYVAVADVRMLGRMRAPRIEDDLPTLLGHSAPSGLRRVADAARIGRLHTGYGGDMLQVIIEACDRAIEDGVSVVGDWIEVGWSDGGVDRDWHETDVLSETLTGAASAGLRHSGWSRLGWKVGEAFGRTAGDTA